MSDIADASVDAVGYATCSQTYWATEWAVGSRVRFVERHPVELLMFQAALLRPMGAWSRGWCSCE